MSHWIDPRLFNHCTATFGDAFYRLHFNYCFDRANNPATAADSYSDPF
jgi:hypothetical protein